MSTSVSVKDIAKQLNISLSTVHKALTGKPGVSEKRRKEVLETAQRLGYTVNPVAQTLSRKDINLGIFMPSSWQEYFEGMRQGIESEIEKLKKYKVKGFFYSISADFSEADAQNALLWLKENAIDALIYCPSMYSLNDEFVTALKKTALPVFSAGGEAQELDNSVNIVTDAPLAGRLAADFLRCVHGQNLKAAVFTGSLKFTSHREKAEAFSKRCESFGGKVVSVFETDDDEQKALQFMQQAVKSDINAIYVATATSAPICRYIEQQGLCGSFSLVCTDIFESIKQYMKKGIVQATISQNQHKVGSIAVRNAYDYLVEKNSYHIKETAQKDTVYVRPALMLLADIE